MKLSGYGRTHLPVVPGVHKIDVPLSKPLPSSLLGSFALFFGYQPELVQPKMLATVQGNHRKWIDGCCCCFMFGWLVLVLRMVGSGEARVSFNIVTKGFGGLGYDV